MVEDTRDLFSIQSFFGLGGISEEHRHAGDVLSARAEQEGFIVDRCKLGQHVRPDVCGYHISDPSYKLIGEAKASESPGDAEAVERLRKYLVLARRGLSDGRKPWSGFAFVLAVAQQEDVEAWEGVLIRLAELAGFETPDLHREQHEDAKLLIWVHTT